MCVGVWRGLPRAPAAAVGARVLPALGMAGDDSIHREGSFWRALSFIEGARTSETINDLEHAREVGYALGAFHHLLSDLPAVQLSDTLPGFFTSPRVSGAL